MPDENISEEACKHTHHQYRLVLLFIFAGFLLFYNLWTGSLRPWDEGWFAEIAREIVVDKLGWLTLHYNHELFFEKPPLFYWMVAVLFKIIGVNEFSVRFWAAFFGLGCIILLYFLAKKLLISEGYAVFSSLTLLGFNVFYKQSRMGMTDVPLTFLILSGVFLFWLGRKRQSFLFWVGPVIGIAFMIKSFAAFQLPIILVLFSLVSGEKRLLINTKFILGIIAGILICLPWHVYQYIQYDTTFLNEYFFTQIAKRSLEVLPGLPSRGLFYYVEMLIGDSPIGIILILTIPYFFFITFKEKDKDRKSAFLLITSAILVIPTLFTLVKTKLPWYIVPIYPFLSMSIVVSVDRIFSIARNYKKKLIMVALIILIVIPIARISLYKKFRILDYRPELKEICLSLNAQTSGSDEIFFYKITDEPTALFYSGRKMIRVSKEYLLNSIDSQKSFICLMSKEDDFYRKLMDENNKIFILRENDKFLLFENK